MTTGRRTFDPDAYNAFRRQIEHEDTLFNQRITWLIALQAILLVPYSNLVRAKLEAISFGDSGNVVSHYEGYIEILAWVGLAGCLLSSISCLAAHLQIGKVTRGYNLQHITAPTFPQIRSGRCTRFFGAFSSVLTFVGFAWVWSSFLESGDPFSAPWFVFGAVCILCIVFFFSTVLERTPKPAPILDEPDESIPKEETVVVYRHTKN